jgi:hypothetical protein
MLAFKTPIVPKLTFWAETRQLLGTVAFVVKLAFVDPGNEALQTGQTPRGQVA